MGRSILHGDERMQLVPCNVMTRLTAILGIVGLLSSTVIGQTATQAPPDSPQPQAAHQFQVTDYSKPFRHFPNPVKPYMPHEVPAPNLSNTSRLDQLMQNGKIMLSLDDAIALALENNLDIAIARYNL